MKRNDHELQVLGAFVHGTLAALHGLGLVYNLRKKNYLDASIHAAAMAYDTWATYKHVNAVKGEDAKEEYPQWDGKMRW